MSKILITHHGYQNCTGWAKVGQDIILALDQAGYDVVPRAILLSEQKSNIHPRIVELENKSDKECDILLNLVLPHHLEYNSNFKNIALFFSETDRIPEEWSSKLNLMDEIWVVNRSMVDACKNSGITKPVHLVRPPVDTSKYEQTYQPIESLKSKLAEEFSFLWIGDLNRRKNLAGILKAFHTEFTTNEPVSLVIKPYKFNHNPQQLTDIVRKMSEEIRIGIKLYPNLNDYKPEIIFGEQLSDEDMLRLHTTTDCFVSCPYGEAHGLSIIDSLGLGKLTLAHKVGGPRDYLEGINEADMDYQHFEDIEQKQDWIEGRANSLTVTENNQILESVFGMNEGFPFLFTSKENWWQPSTTAIMKRMRTAYEMDSATQSILAKNAVATVYSMDYEGFAKRMKELL